jgi:hypothetical protein
MSPEGDGADESSMTSLTGHRSSQSALKLEPLPRISNIHHLSIRLIRSMDQRGRNRPWVSLFVVEAAPVPPTQQSSYVPIPITKARQRVSGGFAIGIRRVAQAKRRQVDWIPSRPTQLTGSRPRSSSSNS